MARARWWSVLMVLAGCAPKPGVVATLDAPAGATWRRARLQTSFDRTSGGGGHGFGGSDHELGAVELVFDDGAPIVLESAVLPAPMFWEPKPIRQLVKGPFELAVSPDGAWVAVSSDAGAQWRLVDVEGRWSCRHLVLPGPLSTLWSRVPTPLVVAVEVLRFEAGQKGPLALDHEFGGDWPQHPFTSEPAAAAEVGRRHATDPGIAAATLGLLTTLSAQRADGLATRVVDIVAEGARADPTLREKLEALFDSEPLGHVTGVFNVAMVLSKLGQPDPVDRVARWASRVATDGDGIAAAFHDQRGVDQGLAQLMWSLAQASFDKGAVTDPVRQAAKAWLQVLAGRLRPRARPAYDTDPEPWSERYSEQVMASYAVMVLGLAGEREFLLGLPRKRQVAAAPWPPRFTRGASVDARVSQGEGPEFVSVSAWLAVAAERAGTRAP